jgi:threonine aldolase
MKTIDLRSDTVTRPSPTMREVMASAELGDDVYGEDAEAIRLQERAAELLGKEAALFVPSGTMANQIAVSVWTRPGDVVLAAEDAHLLLYEGGAAAALSGCQIQTLGTRGLFTADDVRAAAAPDEQHHAATTLVSIENTHNQAGGIVFPPRRRGGSRARHAHAPRWSAPLQRRRRQRHPR